MIEIKPAADFDKTGKIYTPKHHTVADWDFEFGATKRSLSATKFVSAPTSLRILTPINETFYDTILCRIAATQCLPQGEIRNWVYYTYNDQNPACFRNQAALGSANLTNCYLIFLQGAVAKLVRYIAGASSVRDSTTCQTFTSTWTHYRVVFWNGLNPASIAALCVNLYREIAGVWTQEGVTMYDTNNSFKDSATNRAGFLGHSYWTFPEYWDDTEIWGPV